MEGTFLWRLGVLVRLTARVISVMLLGCSVILAGYIWFTLMDQDFNLTNPFIVFPIVVVLYAVSFWLCKRGSHAVKNV